MYKSITRLFDVVYYQEKMYPQEVALAALEDGKWRHYSIREYIDNACAVSRGLLEMGIQPGDKIAMISNNRPEWNFMDIGILQIGAVNVPIYPTAGESDYEYIMNDAKVKLVIVSDSELYAKVSRIKNNVPSLQEVFSFNPIEGVRHWTEIAKLGEHSSNKPVEDLMANVNPEDLATLIYTSGTTGQPKGVMLSHRNIVSNAVNCVERFPANPGKKALSFLPVCHIYERMLIYLYTLKGVEIHYAQSLDTIVADMQVVKPNVFTAVPRLLEKVYDRIIAKGRELSGIKKFLFFWAVDLGLNYEPYGVNGWWYNLKIKVARKLIFSKWKEALGGNVELIASGSAALQPRLARVFLAAQINVMEGYGLTETSPVISVNCMDDRGVVIGTVGRIIPETKVKIAPDGEILVKGPNVMMGYYNKPDKTAEAIDSEGWFHTGDIGEIVGDGFLKITDRKKEIFKTSGGKYIAPQMLENKFKESLFIEQIAVIGENEKHPSALIVPAFEFLKKWAAEHGVEYVSNKDIITRPEVIQRFTQEVENLNKGFGHWEQVKKFELLPEEFSIPGGELTPTLKLKRKAINEKYAVLLNKIYRSEDLIA
ncbi:MAG: long-chain fatty acid--CoA ligase [Bacteroidota bacterium]